MAVQKITIKVLIRKQLLKLSKNGHEVASYPISTSRFGIGNKAGSNKTPLGRHVICNKIGRGAVLGAIFVKRRKAGEVARTSRRIDSVRKDLITTRILRLKGLETEVNCGEGVDSFRRCIYIHGTPDEGLIGRPASHGCIRMKNKDIVELFDLVKRGTTVKICR